MRERFPKWEEKAGNGESRYHRQSEIVNSVLSIQHQSLNKLLEFMRCKGEAIIYLIGARLDHDYGFGSNEIGVAISVLPEDGEKAAEPGYHPGSTEVYIVFQGNMTFETLTDNSLRVSNYTQSDVIVVPAGVCHRVRFNVKQRAASLIVKTNLQHEPKVVRCHSCDYYSDSSQCALSNNWENDKKQNVQAREGLSR